MKTVILLRDFFKNFDGRFQTLNLHGFLIFLAFCNAFDLNNQKILWLPWFIVFQRTINKKDHPIWYILIASIYSIAFSACIKFFLVKEIFGSDKFKLFPSIMHSYSKWFLSGKKKFVNQEVFLSKTNQISLTTMQFLVFHVFLASPNF